MIHTTKSLLSNSLCTFPVQQSVNHYAPSLCPIHTGCESMSAPSLIAFLYSTIKKKLLLAALEITSPSALEITRVYLVITLKLQVLPCL